MRRKALVLICLLLVLSGCGQKPQEKPAVPSAPPAAAQTPSDRSEPAQESSAQALPDRPETAELTFMLEGVEETVPAALYVGEGYSLYIPTEGWRLEDREQEDGVLETVWESTVNDDAELAVLSMGDRTLEQARLWLKAEADDFTLQEDKQGGLWGSDPEERMQLEVRFHEGSGSLYAVVWTYPEAAAEGFGTRLSVLADTFEMTEP